MEEIKKYYSFSSDYSEEKFVIASGLNDVLIAIGISLLSLGIFIQAVLVLHSLTDESSLSAFWIGFFYGLMGLGLSWGLSEYFTRYRKLVLPSMVLVMSIAAFSYLVAAIVLNSFSGVGWVPVRAEEAIDKVEDMMFLFCPPGVLLFYYWRFRFPFALFMIGITVTLAVFKLFDLFLNSFLREDIFFFLAGCLIFLVAMRFDLKDPERRTRFSDCGFWLHLLAAPLLVGALSRMLIPDFSMMSSRQAIIVFVVVFVLGSISVIIDRRSLFMAGLLALGGSIAHGVKMFMNHAQLDSSMLFSLTILILGAFVLFLGMGWVPMRHLLLKYFVPARIAARLRPVEEKRLSEPLS